MFQDTSAGISHTARSMSPTAVTAAADVLCFTAARPWNVWAEHHQGHSTVPPVPLAVLSTVEHFCVHAMAVQLAIPAHKLSLCCKCIIRTMPDSICRPKSEYCFMLTWHTHLLDAGPNSNGSVECNISDI